MGIETDTHVPTAALPCRVATGKENQHQCNQQQDTAGRRQLLQHRPEKLPCDIEDMLALGHSRDASGIDILGVKPVTETGVGLKLFPELVELHAVGDALPELLESRHDGLDSRSVGKERC